MIHKGPMLEEVVRTYFAEQGYFALRSVAYLHAGQQVTDIDVWIYRRHTTGIRTKGIVDVKNKRSPKAFERILWTRGLQLALNYDHALVATASNNPLVNAFAHGHGVDVISRQYLMPWKGRYERSGRISHDELVKRMATYEGHKQDGDWIRRIYESKAALVSGTSFRSFNKVIGSFGFFAERVSTRRYQRELVLRGLHLTAAVACIALDSALFQLAYSDQGTRYEAIADGVTYGESENARTRESIDAVLNVIEGGLENGRVVAKGAREVIAQQFEKVRADILAEYFSRPHNSDRLVDVARELEDRAYRREWQAAETLSAEARSVLGVYSDFVGVDRSAVLGPDSVVAAEPRMSRKTVPRSQAERPRRGGARRRPKGPVS